MPIYDFKCEDCGEDDKEQRGCRRAVAKEVVPGGVWNFKTCLSCAGKDSNCAVCKGSNETPVYRCPRALATPCAKALLPFFFEYYGAAQNGAVAWPDSRGRYFQPVRLVMAFDIMATIKSKNEKADKPTGGK